MHLEPPKQHVYKDNLTEDHFEELREFVEKKKRLKLLEQQNMMRKPRSRFNNNMDLKSMPGSPTSQIDGLGSKKSICKYTTQEKTQCMEYGRYLVTKKVATERLPQELQEFLAGREQTDEKGNIVFSAENNVMDAFMEKVHEIR